MRRSLVSALCACAGDRQKRKARRFLEGLSADELQYIADFLGAWILESGCGCTSSPARMAESIAFGRCLGDLEHRDHNMILLREYLDRCHVSYSPAALRVRSQAG
ncbi:MAG TPA: hypothetical protein VN442_18420 [Bryobacteraceae bacterium]|nr:hypothetical protein [Bryobacteraceae bacterium]